MGFLNIAKNGVAKFRNKIGGGWNATKKVLGNAWNSASKYASDHAEGLGKLADIASVGLSFLGPGGAAIGSAINAGKGIIGQYANKNSAWGKFANSGIDVNTNNDSNGGYSISFKPKNPTATGNYSLNPQASGGIITANNGFNNKPRRRYRVGR